MRSSIRSAIWPEPGFRRRSLAEPAKCRWRRRWPRRTRTEPTNTPENITQDQREALIRYSGTAAAARREESDNAFLASISSGSPAFSREQLTRMHEAGQLPDAQYVHWTKWLDAHNANLAEAASRQTVSADKAAKAKADDAEYSFLLNLSRTQFSSNPDELARQKDALLDTVQAKFTDPERLLRIHKAITDQARRAANGEDEFGLPEGKIVQKYIDEAFRTKQGEYQALYLDPSGLFNKDESQDFQRARFYEVQEMARDQLRKGKTAQEVVANIKTEVEKLNDGEIKTILSGASPAAAAVPVPEPDKRVGALRRVIDGRVAVFDKNQKFVKWED